MSKTSSGSHWISEKFPKYHANYDGVYRGDRGNPPFQLLHSLYGMIWEIWIPHKELRAIHGIRVSLCLTRKAEDTHTVSSGHAT